MKRIFLPVLTALALVLAVGYMTATRASAGEVKGPPGPGGAEGGTTPIDGFWTGDGAASICSFSGLNDVVVTDPESDEYEPTQTQSFGTFLVLFMNEFDASAQEVRAVFAALEGGSLPNQACNPNNFPLGNPKKAG